MEAAAIVPPPSVFAPPPTLRSFIALAAPATRTPCTGGEADVRVEFGFTPRWFRSRCDVDFSERWHLDPLYRAKSLERMRRAIERPFPGLDVGARRPGVPAEAPGSTLDGVHGALLVPMMFAIPARYDADNWPAALPAFLSRDLVARLEVPRSLPDVPVFAQLLEQADIIEREFGRVEGYINWQGVLNTAFRIRGPEIFADVLADPPLAGHLFEVIARTMVAGMECLYARQRRTGVDIRHATVSNCVVNMVSPDIYAERLFPWDSFIAERFETLGIHNCAWNVDPYIDTYSRVANLGYVDMGMTSDFCRAKRLCPDARRAVMYSPSDLENKTPEAIQADLARIRRDLAPCDIVMADIDAETPDERVRDFAEWSRRV